MTVLDHLMSEVLPDVNVLRTLSTTNDVVSPLDARGVVLVHRSRGSLAKPMLSRRLHRYKTSVAAVDAE